MIYKIAPYKSYAILLVSEISSEITLKKSPILRNDKICKIHLYH